MKFTVITPNFNGAAFLEATIESILQQRTQGIELEYIVVDGGSTDGSHAIIERYGSAIDRVIIEQDQGPAQAINKGLALATGDIVSWLNADDLYHLGTLLRVAQIMEQNPKAPFCFGDCVIVNQEGMEIRKAISLFKRCFFPFSSRFAIQCINYISQPSLFFRRNAQAEAGFLRTDMVAAWDYEFILRLWRLNPGIMLPGSPLSSFRWHPSSISGRYFKEQFKEEYQAAVADTGQWSLQALLHYGVQLGIVSIYQLLSLLSKATAQRQREDR